ncbi:hypothetical protein Ahy_A06g025950 [Arachis hypogaea]|uniref:Transposase-associated domain-containing protein n=1 Tax=Arachis hypogaea TaxID=3818 RepID=A0A445CJ25_ARAHY|nr:hypothetical protein Ahy_A06g025950 [Arachis hypogaea]
MLLNACFIIRFNSQSPILYQVLITYFFLVVGLYFTICRRSNFFIKLDIDKSWISKSRVGAEYRDGLTRFLDFAFANASSDGMIRCPCPKCGFRLLQNREDAFDHLVINPFPSTYTFWIHHGERREVEPSSDGQEDQSEQHFNAPMLDMVHDAFNFPGLPGPEEDSENEPDGDAMDELPNLYNEPSRETRNFHDLLEDGKQELYPGCSKFSKLSFLVRLYHIKSMCGVSDKAFGMILELLADAFEHARIPSIVHDAKKIHKKTRTRVQEDRCMSK